jgi:hypothetical protein
MSIDALARRAGESPEAHLVRLDAIDPAGLTIAEQAELVFQLCGAERERRQRQQLLPLPAPPGAATGEPGSETESVRRCG